MMECKKALAEAQGNMARAEEILRVKLGNKAAKASTRVAAEGIVAIDVGASDKVGSIVEVNCETDFVAKNEEFQAFARALAALVTARAPADVAALAALPLRSTSVEAERIALIGKIGENISIRRFARLQAVGRLLSYVHGGSKIGVLVDLTGATTRWARTWRCTSQPESPGRCGPTACRPKTSRASGRSRSRRRPSPASRPKSRPR